MPRSSKKKEQPTPKKNEATNKKRKRSEEDVDNKTSSKKIKVGWLRDIKAVLRSAGNRIVESESKLTRPSVKKSSKDKKKQSEIIFKNEDRIDQVGMEMMENSIMPITNTNLVSKIDHTIDNDDRKRGSLVSTKRNTQNDLEESCIFQQIQCKASGTIIRLENVPPYDTHETSNSADVDNYVRAVEKENRAATEIGNLVEMMVSNINNDIEREQDDLPAPSFIDIGILQDNNFASPALAETMKDSDKRCINGLKNNNHYFFGTDDRIDNSRSDTGFTFASSHSEQRPLYDSMTETNEDGMDMNEYDNVESPRSDNSDSAHNLTGCWINTRSGNCTTQNGYMINGSDEYQLPSTINDNTIIDNDSVEIPQEEYKFPIAQAYYDSNTGAYVDPSTLQDSKAHNSTSSFKNTWGSIKNLLSRVSGNKGSGDARDNQPEDIAAEAEEDLHS